jgi:hypothetical protein
LSAKRWLMKIFFGFSSLDIIFPLGGWPMIMLDHCNLGLSGFSFCSSYFRVLMAT